MKKLSVKEVEPKEVSEWLCKCHNKPVRVYFADEGTNAFICCITRKPCDAHPSETSVKLPCCERCGATLLLFDKHKCGELEYPAYQLLDVTEKVEESKLNTLSSGFGHKDIIPETNEANSVMISAEIVKLMLEDAKLEERQRVVEMIIKISKEYPAGKLYFEWLALEIETRSDLQSKLIIKNKEDL